MAWRTAEKKRAYQRSWAKQFRLKQARLAYEAGDYSRRTVNRLGRASCAPDEKWCAWAQHRRPKTAFRAARRNKDGLQDMCRDCQDMSSRVGDARTKRRHRHTHR